METKRLTDPDRQRSLDQIIKMLAPFCEIRYSVSASAAAGLIGKDELSELIGLFFRIIELPKAKGFEGIDGIDERLSLSDKIYREFSPDATFTEAEELFTDFSRIEAIIKHLIFRLRPDIWAGVSANNKMLAPCLVEIGLLPPRTSTEAISDLASATPEDIYLTQRPNFPYLDHILRAYQCRNVESHECPVQTRCSLVMNEVSLWMTYLYTVKRFKSEALAELNKQTLASHRREEYCKKIIQEDGNKGFEYFPFKWNRGGELIDIESTFDYSRTVLYGEAGSGKTIAMKQLYAIAAKRHLDDLSSPIPIFIELKSLSGEPILSRAKELINTSEHQLAELLERGHVYLFLDGINEVVGSTPAENVSARRGCIRQIASIISDYPKTKVWITDRGVTSFGSLLSGARPEEIEIQRMTKEDICGFCRQLGTEAGVSEVFRDMELDEATVSFLNTPFKIKIFAELSIASGRLPSKADDLLGQYLNCLIERECNEKWTLTLSSPNVFFMLLIEFSRAIKENNDGELPFVKVIEIFNNRLKSLGEEETAQQCLQIALELKILSQPRANWYGFSSELYKDYFFAQYMWQHLNNDF